MKKPINKEVLGLIAIALAVTIMMFESDFEIRILVLSTTFSLLTSVAFVGQLWGSTKKQQVR